MPSSIPTPPPDASGGYLVLQVVTSTDTHRFRIHVAPFNSAFVYTPTIGSGAETGIADTATLFMNVLKGFYKTTSTLSLLAVYQIVSGTPVERFGWAVPTAVSGTRTDADPTDQGRAVQQNYNFKSVLGGRARVSIIGGPLATLSLAQRPYRVTSSNDTLGYALANYLAGANSATRCHDGGTFSPLLPMYTVCVNRKLRRRYGMA